MRCGFKARQHHQAGGLARTGRAQHGQEFALANRQIQIFDDKRHAVITFLYMLIDDKSVVWAWIGQIEVSPSFSSMPGSYPALGSRSIKQTWHAIANDLWAECLWNVENAGKSQTGRPDREQPLTRVAFDLTQEPSEYAQFLGRILIPIERDAP